MLIPLVLGVLICDMCNMVAFVNMLPHKNNLGVKTKSRKSCNFVYSFV